MALLTLGSTSSYARTSESQEDIGTATTLGLKVRVSGAYILGGAPGSSNILHIGGAGAASGTRLQIVCAVAGGNAYVLLVGPGSTNPQVAAATAASNYNSGESYVIRAVAGPGGCSVAVYNEAGSVVASASAGGVTLSNNDEGTGYINIGATGLGAVASSFDGVEICNQAPPANNDAPRATDTGILWAVLDGVVGQLVPGATDLDDLSGATWGAGGTWDPPVAAAITEGAESGGTSTATRESAAATSAGAESGSVSVAARSTATATSAGAESGDSASAEVGKLAFVAETAESEAASTVTGTFHAGTTDGAESADAHAAALTTAVATSEAAEAGDDQNAVIGGDVVWGFLGDSQTDEYQGTDDRGPPEVLNWMEILVERSRIFAGAWGTRSEPRRTGYAYNWARSGAQSPGVISDQLAGLAAQVADGSVTHVGYMAPGNDWLNPSGPLYAVTIYNGDGTEDSEGELLTDIIATVVGWHETIMDAIDAALDTAESGGGMVVMTPQDYMAAPPAWAVYSDATRRGYVTGVIEAIHSQVAAYAAGLNIAAGYTRFAVIRADHYLLDVWGTASGDYLTISGAQVDMVNPWEYDAETYDPYTLALASTGGLQHAGTLMGGEYARAFVYGANQLAGVDVDPLTNSEILAIAGIPVGDTTEGAESGGAATASLTTAAGGLDGAESADAQEATATIIGATADGADAGDVPTAQLTTVAATEAGAESADANTVGRITRAATAEGALSGDAAEGVTGEAAGLITDGAESADAHAASLTTAASTADGAEAGALVDGQTGNVRSTTERAESDDTHAAIFTGLAACAEGAEAGGAHVGVVLREDMLTEGAEAGDTVAAAVGNLSFVSDGAEADDVQAAIAELLASLPESAEAGDTWDAMVFAAAVVVEGAEASDEYEYPSDATPPYRASLTVTSRRASLTVTSRRASLTVEDA